MSELKLQQQCFMWHWNTHPGQRGLLFMNYNNPKNALHGAILKGLGLVAGVADMTYLSPRGVVLIEMKWDNGKQSPVQIEWQRKVQAAGYRYEVVRTFEEFKQLIERTQQDYEFIAQEFKSKL
jgi:hypothetical protein